MINPQGKKQKNNHNNLLSKKDQTTDIRVRQGKLGATCNTQCKPPRPIHLVAFTHESQTKKKEK